MKMIDETKDATTDDERLFDRLADGELDNAGRHALLSRLDEVPGGWRRCALSLLEAQAWRSELRLTAGRSDVGALQPANSRGEQSRSARARRTALLALALVATFSIGRLSHPLGDSIHDEPSAGALRTVVRHEADDVKAPDLAAPDSSTPTTELPPGVRLAGILSFQIDESGQSREVQVPVLEGPGIDSRWLLEQTPIVRASIVKELERRGHKVEAHRQLLTVGLKDGRKVILPVDQVDVRFANRVYQ
jgi:hypothetical protein